MKVAIIYYSTYGHIVSMAEAVKAGIEKSGNASKVQIFQVPETLSKEVLGKMHAAPKAKYPVATTETLVEYDAFVFGYPTRFGTLPGQLMDYLGQTGGLWASGALAGKPVTFFTSVSTSAGGQEITLRNFIAYVAHHGMVYIPLGYAAAFADLANMDEVHGGSSYGAATYAGPDGSRQPSALEKRIASAQGENFSKFATKFVSAKTTKTEKPAKATQKRAEPVKAAQESASKVAEKPTQAARSTQSKMMVNREEKTGCAKCVIV